MPDWIQLGTLSLAVGEAFATVADFKSQQWCRLDPTILDVDSLPESERSTVDLLRILLSDRNLEMKCSGKRIDDRVILRISITPIHVGSFGPTKSKRLHRLFELLEKGWDGGGGKLLDPPNEDAHVGMQALYSLIESPSDPQLYPPEFIGDDEVHESLVNYDNPVGVRTLMYKYQIRSVARMLQMETQPGTLTDPTYSPFNESGTSNKYYVNLDPRVMDIQRSVQSVTLTRGGILCEQMGVGKTLMCLALVAVSRHQATQPAEDAYETSAVMTDMALYHYPTESMDEIRKRVDEPARDLRGTPSLAALCADIVVRDHSGARWSVDPPLSPSVKDLLDQRSCIYYRFPPPPRMVRRAKNSRIIPCERVLLAKSTLVVVPNILVPQWVAEAETHLEEGALDILVISEGAKPLPGITELARHDIILMSLERFRREGRRDPDQLTFTTVLLQARWKRIILDEGNSASNDKSDSMILAEALNVERRWIVSGTPTTRLKQGTESAVQSLRRSENMQRVDSARSAEYTTVSSTNKKKEWTKADLDDVSRLGRMLRGFLSASMFSSQLFAQMVTKPLRNSDGPQYGAVERIRTIMSAVMVKHRPGVVDEEVKIPSSILTAETLHFTHWQRLTYNALTALVASNVYTSNFEDADYFLHHRNAEAFNQVVANLHLACFWFSSPDMDIEGALERTENYLNTKTSLSTQQRRGLEEAVIHFRTALDTPGWSEWMQNSAVSMPLDVGSSLPDAIRDAWSDTPEQLSSLIDAHSISLLRGLNKPGKSLNDIVHSGWDERAKRPNNEEAIKRAQRLATGADDWEWHHGAVGAPRHHRDDARAAADKPKTLKVVKSPKKGKKGDELETRLDEATRNARQAAVAKLPRPLPAVIWTTSLSAKVNHILHDVLDSPPEDKFVIFGTFEEIAHLTEALDLVGISSAYAGARVNAENRKTALNEFRDPNIRVCLLELKFAARGLTLTHANRMIFLSPVWSLDVQAQAIKRIHRIGQIRPTKIEILVTEGTFEEDILLRESSARSNEDETRYSRALIENPRFVSAESSQKISFPIRLAPPPPPDPIIIIDQKDAPPSPAVMVSLTPDKETSSPENTALVTPVIAELGSQSPRGIRKRVVAFVDEEDDDEEAPKAGKRLRFTE